MRRVNDNVGSRSRQRVDRDRCSPNQIMLLRDMLCESGISNDLQSCYDGWMVIYPGNPKTYHDVVCTVIWRVGSYGYRQGLLQIDGLLTQDEQLNDSVLGYLTARQVFDRILDHWILNHE